MICALISVSFSVKSRNHFSNIQSFLQERKIKENLIVVSSRRKKYFKNHGVLFSKNNETCFVQYLSKNCSNLINNTPRIEMLKNNFVMLKNNFEMLKNNFEMLKNNFEMLRNNFVMFF